MVLHIYIKANINTICGGLAEVVNSSLLLLFFLLTITFCLVSAGIFKASTSIGMAAYAKKSKESSGGSSGSDGGGSKSGDSGGSGSDDVGSSNEKGGDNSGNSGGTGSETGAND